MTPRADGRNYLQVLKPVLALAEYVEHSSPDPVLKDLISFRASQMNGCAYCRDMHSREISIDAKRKRGLGSRWKSFADQTGVTQHAP